MASSYSDKVYSAVLTTTLATLSTTPASATFVMKGWWVSNSNAAGQKIEFQVDGKRYVPYQNDVPAGDTIQGSNLDIAVLAGKNMKARAEIATDLDIYIYGIEEVTK